MGSCVVIVTAARYALALTVVHNLKYAESFHQRDALRELKVAPGFQKPEFDNEFKARQIGLSKYLSCELFVALPGGSLALAEKVQYFPGKALDIAVLGLQIGKGPALSFPMKCSIASYGPVLGEEVMLCGFPHGNHVGIDAASGSLQIAYRQQRLVGTVTERFDWGCDHLVRSPGFRIDVGAPSGLSGGAVLQRDECYGYTLCGIISAASEISTTAALIYPALTLENLIPHTAEVPHTLLGLCSMPNGLLDVSKASEHLQVVSNRQLSHLSEHVIWN